MINLMNERVRLAEFKFSLTVEEAVHLGQLLDEDREKLRDAKDYNLSGELSDRLIKAIAERLGK